MRLAVAIILVTGAFAADPRLLSLEQRAQSDFERVALVSDPQLADATACVQSEAAVLPVAPVAETSAVHYQKGYCSLIGALITHEASDFADAAAEFDKAAALILPPAASSALPVLASIARLELSPDQAAIEKAQAVLAYAEDRAACHSAVMPVDTCQAYLAVGRLWSGWIDLRQDDLSAAQRDFATAPQSAWAEWVLGRQAFQQRIFEQAVRHYRTAIERWPSERSHLLWPKPDMGLMLTDLGGAQLLAGDPAGAIATLDRAAKDDPNHARTYYFRARAKELTGQTEAAQADYSLASRTAFAGAKDLASGEAHLYRGILLYRRKDYTRAEAEFASALNFEIPAALRPDASAWRHLAAVAAGSCGASRDQLAGALAIVSPYFPRAEAQDVINSCSINQTAAR
jgi:tetratricopeptide (TPR) repeat protein